jgi:thiol-disulfide isomerase/thioredoxin
VKAAAKLLFIALPPFLLLASAPSLFCASIGEPAPTLVVQDLSGREFDLAKLQGNVVVVNFWATWCPRVAGKCLLLTHFTKNIIATGWI